ncbi:MAG: N-acetyl-gamma-glutamyl-phosphate reductase [Omnitrophica WOR_2 bacterium RBG_13_41_10]|nr:MAG: N-acetyl-gamma-glutamyl-phosphate reductase [Omnitrophica WOR_2 bacterium RBG_13_41_10]
MVNVAIVGVTGYAGEELLGILLKPPAVRITSVSAKIDKPLHISEIFPKFKNRIDLVCAQPNIKDIVADSELVFLALPHTVSMEIAPKLLNAGKRIIDLSADYRLGDIKVYKEFYHCEHKDKKNIPGAIYGLPELYRQDIKNASLVANPGCYPTAAILALSGVLACDTGLLDLTTIFIDAKSGVTGAGRKIAEGFLFSEINEDFKAYKVDSHQHMPEINQELSKIAKKKIKVTFVPHLLPVNRGILETIYIKKTKKLKAKSQKLITLYKKFYNQEPFVRICQEGVFPRLKDVVGTNFCDIGIQEEADKVIIVAAIDNLLKGASGQAVQNMNIMYKFPEQAGLL